MTFESAYRQWFGRQLAEPLSGGQRHRLEEGHGHAERMFLQQVWYPAFRSFDGLYGEYEVADFKDGSRYLDFAYIREPMKLAIEIDGYETHLGKVSRWQFSDNLMRQNHLVIDGWHILRFSYDDITSRPRMCEQLLQQYMGCWLGSDRGRNRSSSASELLESEVLRFALQLARPLRPRDVMELLGIRKDWAYEILHEMLHKKTLLPSGKATKKIRNYIVNRERYSLPPAVSRNR